MACALGKLSHFSSDSLTPERRSAEYFFKGVAAFRGISRLTGRVLRGQGRGWLWVSDTVKSGAWSATAVPKTNMVLKMGTGSPVWTRQYRPYGRDRLRR